MKLSVGAKLKLLRNLKPWVSQADVAREIGVSRQLYNGYENGKFEPTLQNLKALSQYHGIPIDDIVENDISKIDCEKALIIKAEASDNLSQEEKDKFINLLKKIV
ncbi:helix-turn-helix transcriptional regulator [Bacillus gaemokensis]|uniref:HTH cro/C1-type domain-containing protein n=1 Tax=Bacillus gaemokensis TaxID=574375 RepID=A0A073KBN3_9BACI|nr:helix-turn-helix transcriptional regulator [Bacillus gaemokensis]KEK23867.1 hypothetical protein BAGA_05330 [Bacillus gaemokensis]KYG38107.1 hypothetical protein AZF08_20365 [Bacillus gaemokensis]